MKGTAKLEALRALAGDDVIPLGFAPVVTGALLVSSTSSETWDWLVVPIEHDVLFKTKRLGIPESVRHKLTDLDSRGVWFDHFLVAHEVPQGSLEASPGPIEIEAVLDSLAKHAERRHVASLEKTVRRLQGVVRATSKGALVTVGASLTPLLLLANADPVLIGGSEPERGSQKVAAYFEVARW